MNQIQRLVRPAKVGHAGTLDPLATGVLVVAVGRATRLIQYVQRLTKYYVGQFELGKTSDTEDVSGHVVSSPDWKAPSRDQLEQVCRKFVGELSQIPPAYSALKIKGKRAYEVARGGGHVELAARTVLVRQIKLLHYDSPSFEISVVCGSGTYIRSLGRDIGEALGCGAVMSALRRTAIGTFSLERSCDLNALVSSDMITQSLQPLVAGVQELPRVKLSSDEQRAIGYGQQIRLPSPPSQQELAATSADDELLAVLTPMSDGQYRPAINLCP